MERRSKHWDLPKIRGRKHQTHPSALFSPIFSRAREKIGPPEARQKRPRRNEPPQATSLFLCARFFLSKPQTEFAVWVFPCRSATTSQSASLTALREGSQGAAPPGGSHNLSVSLRLTAPLEGEPRGCAPPEVLTTSQSAALTASLPLLSLRDISP